MSIKFNPQAALPALGFVAKMFSPIISLPPMKTIAIDPGPEQSAILQWDGERVIDPYILLNSELLDMARTRLPFAPLAVEMVACYGMPVGKEVFETCLLIGRLQEIWGKKGLKFCLVYRRDVKMHLCGNMRAKDSNIRQALIDRFGAPGTKKSPGKLYGVSKDLWSALAVAVAADGLRLFENETKTLI